MSNFNRKAHWENVYQTRELSDVSWYQPTPETSLQFIDEFNLSKTAKIIDVGGGDSFLVDHLLNAGFKDITVLDISEGSLERAKKRLGEKANLVKWIVADASNFEPEEKYDFWHDRAAFHFLTKENEIENYLKSVQKGLKPSGAFVLGTFSENGPLKCSGIEIKQYSENSMVDRLKGLFKKVKCILVNHKTPKDKIQHFTFCSFRKIA